jgi:hypothetical protein
MKKSKSKRAETYVKNLQEQKIQRRKMIVCNSQLFINDKEISKEIKNFLQEETFDYSPLSTLYDNNIQWLDEIIKSLKEVPIEDEFDYLQYYLLYRELSISMKEQYRCLYFKIRFGIVDEKKIEDLSNQSRLIKNKLDKLINPEGNNQKGMRYQVTEILLNAIRQSISNRSKELMN